MNAVGNTVIFFPLRTSSYFQLVHNKKRVKFNSCEHITWNLKLCYIQYSSLYVRFENDQTSISHRTIVFLNLDETERSVLCAYLIAGELQLAEMI